MTNESESSKVQFAGLISAAEQRATHAHTQHLNSMHETAELRQKLTHAQTQLDDVKRNFEGYKVCWKLVVWEIFYGLFLFRFAHIMY
jgi:hypothetical protein